MQYNSYFLNTIQQLVLEYNTTVISCPVIVSLIRTETLSIMSICFTKSFKYSNYQVLIISSLSKNDH